MLFLAQEHSQSVMGTYRTLSERHLGLCVTRAQQILLSYLADGIYSILQLACSGVENMNMLLDSAIVAGAVASRS